MAGRDFKREDRAELLQLKLEATQVFGFMWEGLQQKDWAPMWEWSVIMSRKVVIIMIILLFQNFHPCEESVSPGSVPYVLGFHGTSIPPGKIPKINS